MVNIQKQQQKQEKKSSKMHDRFERYISVAAASSFPSGCSHNWQTQAFGRKFNSRPELKTQHLWNQELQNTQSILLYDVAWWRAWPHSTTLKRHNALTSWWRANPHFQWQQTFSNGASDFAIKIHGELSAPVLGRLFNLICQPHWNLTKNTCSQTHTVNTHRPEM